MGNHTNSPSSGTGVTGTCERLFMVKKDGGKEADRREVEFVDPIVLTSHKHII